jgi:hypothetical protein
MPCTPPSSRPPVSTSVRPAFRVPNALKNFLNPTPGRPNNSARLASVRPNNDATCKGQPAPPPPLLASLSLVFAASGAFGNRPDDDIRVRVDGRTVYDPRRNVGWYPSANVTLDQNTAGIVDGSLVEIDTFDGWSSGWQSKPWTATVTWSDGHQRVFGGGSLLSGPSPIIQPRSPAYFLFGPHFLFYIPNGSFIANRLP